MLRPRINLAVCFAALLLSAPGVTQGVECLLAPYDCALAHVERTEFKRAAEILEKWLEESFSDLRAMNLLGVALTGAGDTARANEQFYRILKKNPAFLPARKNLAINEFNLGHTDLAKLHFEAVLQSEPSNAVSRLYLGEIAFASGNCALALEHYEGGVPHIWNNSGAILRYSHCLLQEGKRDAAVEALRRIAPGQADVQFQAGRMLGEARLYLEAAEHFGLSRHAGEDPYAAGYNQVFMLVEAAMFKEAITVWTGLLSDEVFRTAELYNLIAEAYLRSGQLQEAYDSLRASTQRDPRYEKSYGDLVSLCMDFANYHLGLDIANIGLHHLPDSYRLHVQRGVMKAKLGQLEDAEKDFQRASDLSPQDPLPPAAIAIAWMQKGDLSKALGFLRGQLGRSPKYFLSYYLFGEALVRSGAAVGSAEDDEALQAFEIAAQLHPGFAPVRASLGKLLLRRDQVDAAIPELEAAIALDPSGSAAVYQLARAHQKQGNLERAKELVARVHEIAGEERDRSLESVLQGIMKESTTKSHTAAIVESQ